MIRQAVGARENHRAVRIGQLARHRRTVVGCGVAATLLACLSTPSFAPPVELSYPMVREERGVPMAYRNLLDVLEGLPDRVPGPAVRRLVIDKARAFQDALAHDGGARDALNADAHNIIASLSDGTFSGSGSIAALRRDAKGNVVEAAGPWHPETMPGRRPIGPIASDLRQGGIGNCVGLSVVKAFATTPIGSALLRASVAQGADGNFRVMMPGAPGTVYEIPPSELAQFGAGEAPALAIVAASYRHFHIDPRNGTLPTNKMMALLSMGHGYHERLWDKVSSPSDIAAYLRRQAPRVGRDVAMVFGGRPDRDGAWSRGDGHAFAVIRIDLATDTVVYTNPWDSRRERTIAIDTLSRSASGTSADFETVTFERAPSMPTASNPDAKKG